MRLMLESESIGRTGGITGSGAQKVLGAPRLESLEVVIREAIQNSWDAAESDKIKFGVIGYEFDSSQKSALLEALRDGTRGSDRIISLPEDGPLDALILWDKGTSGLGGEVRPEQNADGARDFVRFVYMIGDTKIQTDALAKGGTYGFGRSSFITASGVGTILVHTICSDGGRGTEGRFIGMTWTDPERQGGRSLTGRHWWGSRDREDRILPVTGTAANALARSLGMNALDAQDRGTAILILAPRWSASVDDLARDVDVARHRAFERIRSGLLWHCWPRLLDKTIGVSIRWFGRDIDVPDPLSDPRLRAFARAYELTDRTSIPRGMWKTPLKCQRPEQELGTVTLAQLPFVASEREAVEEVDDGDEVRDTQQPLHHVALMRGTRLVIRYFAAPPPPEGLQYAGVFIAHPDVDAIYAASEPPAHDDWVRERLAKPNERRFINVTFKRLQEAVRSWLHPDAGDATEGGEESNLGLLADRLGTLFVDVEGDGGADGTQRAGGGGEGQGGGGGRKRINVEVLEPTRVAQQSGVELRVPVRVSQTSGRSTHVTLTARALVLVDGGREKEPPSGAAIPKVIGWQLGQDTMLVKEPKIELTVDDKKECVVTLFQPRDCFVRLVVDVE